MFLATVLIAALVLACSAFSDETEARNDTFSVGGSPWLIVDGDNGSITINPGEESTITVVATLRNPEGIEYSASQDGDLITIEAKSDSRGVFDFGESPGVDLEITTPPKTKLELRTSNGKIEVRGIHESGAMHTSNGDVVMDDVIGAFVLLP